MKTIEVKSTFLLDYDQFENIIVTALEGGSNYWYYLNSEDVPPRIDDTPASVRIAKAIWYDGYILPVYDLEDNTELLGEISLESFKEFAGLCDWALTDLVEGRLDAESADALFQLGVMGEVVFG